MKIGGVCIMNEIRVIGCHASRVGEYKVFVPTEEIPRFRLGVRSDINLDTALDNLGDHGTTQDYHNPIHNTTYVDVELRRTNGGLEARFIPIGIEGRRKILHIADSLQLREQLVAMYLQSFKYLLPHTREREGRELLEMVGVVTNQSPEQIH